MALGRFFHPYIQRVRIDYIETFSTIMKMTIVRTLISIEVKKGWDLFQLDVNNVFLHGDLHKKVYVEVPQGLQVDTPSLVCKLKIIFVWAKARQQAMV